MKGEKTKSRKSVLIIEDDTAYAGSVKKWLEAEGYRTMTSGDAVEGLERFRTACPDVVLLDLSLPPSNSVDEGLALLREILKADPDGKVLILTGEGTTEAAIESMHLGAEDFFLKPLDPDVLLIVIERALYKKSLEGEIRALQKKLFEGGYHGIIGRSAPMRQLFDNLGQVASSQANVLIVGENGTGKELIAQILHGLSSRRGQRMIPLNCAALSEGVCESELFGHEKGAFTDADRRRLGAFELADRGSLFLDEVGDIPPRIQVKLLRAIEEKRFQRVGGNDVINVDFRVICATNQDLGRMIEGDQFREDLYHRLSTVILRVPPLRDRVEDIPLLANHFLDVYGRIENRNIVSINPEVLDIFRNYHWPGNVRELENEIHWLVIQAPNNSDITPEMLSERFPEREPASLSTDSGGLLRDRVEETEVRTIRQALEKNHWNITRTAEELGLSRQGLYLKIRRYRLQERQDT